MRVSVFFWIFGASCLFFSASNDLEETLYHRASESEREREREREQEQEPRARTKKKMESGSVS
jgi:hypothetical protein